jgi:hypothetical protein
MHRLVDYRRNVGILDNHPSVRHVVIQIANMPPPVPTQRNIKIAVPGIDVSLIIDSPEWMDNLNAIECRSLRIITSLKKPCLASNPPAMFLARCVDYLSDGLVQELQLFIQFDWGKREYAIRSREDWMQCLGFIRQEETTPPLERVLLAGNVDSNMPVCVQQEVSTASRFETDQSQAHKTLGQEVWDCQRNIQAVTDREEYLHCRRVTKAVVGDWKQLREWRVIAPDSVEQVKSHLEQLQIPNKSRRAVRADARPNNQPTTFHHRHVYNLRVPKAARHPKMYSCQSRYGFR